MSNAAGYAQARKGAWSRAEGDGVDIGRRKPGAAQNVVNDRNKPFGVPIGLIKAHFVDNSAVNGKRRGNFFRCCIKCKYRRQFLSAFLVRNKHDFKRCRLRLLMVQDS